jgi:hypothetical protein
MRLRAHRWIGATLAILWLPAAVACAGSDATTSSSGKDASVGSSPDAAPDATTTTTSDAAVGAADGGTNATDGGDADAGLSYEQECANVVAAFCKRACDCTVAVGYCCANSEAGTNYFCYTPCEPFLEGHFCRADAGDRSAQLQACSAALPSAQCDNGPDAGRGGVEFPPECAPLY